MSNTALVTLLVLSLEGVLFGALLLAIEIAYRVACVRRFPPAGAPSVTAVSGVVFSLMGLVLAFSYSDASKRLDAQRELVVAEANAIGRVWQRIDVVDAPAQEPLRELLRLYLDERMAAHDALPVVEAFEEHRARARTLQQQIWTLMVAASTSSFDKHVLLLPPVLTLSEVASKRTVAVRTHISSPTLVFMLGITLVGAMLVGVSTAQGEGRNWIYRLVFATVVSAAIHVVIDMEYPRTGIVSTQAADSLLLELRDRMK